MINHTAVCQSFTCGCTYSLVPFFPSPRPKPLPPLAPLTAPPGNGWNLSLLSALTFGAGGVLGCGVHCLLGANHASHGFGWARAVLQACSIYSGNKMHVADSRCLPGVWLCLDSLLLFTGVLGTWVFYPPSSSRWQRAVLGWELGSKR